MAFPTKVKIVEVGPRDGLQNEKIILAPKIKIDFINQLASTGLKVIEATSFVSPKWIPQLADNREVYAGIHQQSGVSYPVLIPNVQGLENALAMGVKDIAVFTTPSEIFSEKNTHCTVSESMARIAEIMKMAKQHHLSVRGYISCVLGCPYEGDISFHKVAILARELYQMGCSEISLGDTIGVGTPLKVKQLIEVVSEEVPTQALAVHFHDTYGQALVNIYSALEVGIATIDSSVAGLGGCPYAEGASGNVSTEDVVYLLNGMGIHTGVSLEKLAAVGMFISKQLGRISRSKVGCALINQQK